MASVYKRKDRGRRERTCWYIGWTDHAGKRRTQSSHTTDRAAAIRIANQLEADAALRRDGVIDSAAEAVATESQRLIVDHVVEFCEDLTARQNTAKHVRTMRKPNSLRALTWILNDSSTSRQTSRLSSVAREGHLLPSHPIRSRHPSETQRGHRSIQGRPRSPVRSQIRLRVA